MHGLGPSAGLLAVGDLEIDCLEETSETEFFVSYCIVIIRRVCLFNLVLSFLPCFTSQGLLVRSVPKALADPVGDLSPVFYWRDGGVTSKQKVKINYWKLLEILLYAGGVLLVTMCLK
jgi:hypothetical protein